jgi:hypothetical protein
VKDGTSIALKWDTDHPEGADLVVVRDLRRNIERSVLRKPSKLIFHHVFLTADHDGPHVFVYGKPGSPVFWCKYCPTTEWVSAGEATQ